MGCLPTIYIVNISLRIRDDLSAYNFVLYLQMKIVALKLKVVIGIDYNFLVN